MPAKDAINSTGPTLGHIFFSLVAVINTGHEVPIIRIADFGIVGDLFEVVPVVIEELKKLQSER